MTNTSKGKNTFRKKIEEILKHSDPPEADWHGGVKDWEYYYNKEGLKYLLDQLEQIHLEEVERIIGKDEELFTKQNGTLPDEGIKNLIRNQLKSEMRKRIK